MYDVVYQHWLDSNPHPRYRWGYRVHHQFADGRYGYFVGQDLKKYKDKINQISNFKFQVQNWNKYWL
jgi:hypothetical protein